MPAWVFIAGRIGNSIVVSLLMLALLAAIGGVLYGVAVPWERLPAILVTLVVGAASFCCLGIALTAAIPSQDAAAPIVNAAAAAALLPLRRLHPRRRAPRAACIDFADHFPIRHFFEAFFDAYVPTGGGAGVRVGQPGDRRRLGRRRPAARDPLLPLDAARAAEREPVGRHAGVARYSLPRRCSTTSSSRSPTSSAAPPSTTRCSRRWAGAATSRRTRRSAGASPSRSSSSPPTTRRSRASA